MKRKLPALLLAAMLTILPCTGMIAVRAEDAAAEQSMPPPYFDEGDSVFCSPCKKLDTIPDKLRNLISEERVASWLAFHDAILTDIATSLTGYPNICSFIRSFALEDTDVRSALDGKLSADELEVLLNGTDEEILACFASDETIVIGDSFYTPEWVYQTPESRYSAAGLTPERLAEQFPFYRQLHLTEDAAEAFSEKLLRYTGIDPALKGFSEPVIMGDANQDGIISSFDAVLLQKYIHGTAPFNYVQWASADMDSNGMVDVFDLTYLKRMLLHQQPSSQEVSLPVMEFSQHPTYPTGCESAALYMLLKYYHVEVTMPEIVDVLPKGPLPYTQNGTQYGANPEREFVGDPRDSYSYGVFNRPLATTASHFKSGVITKTGASLSEVIALLDEGSPVVAWYCTNPDAGISYRREWYDYQTGELIRWPAGEHAVVICGHDAVNLTYRDPNTGGSRTMAQSRFQEVFDELGGRILYYES